MSAFKGTFYTHRPISFPKREQGELIFPEDAGCSYYNEKGKKTKNPNIWEHKPRVDRSAPIKEQIKIIRDAIVEARKNRPNFNDTIERRVLDRFGFTYEEVFNVLK